MSVNTTLTFSEGSVPVDRIPALVGMVARGEKGPQRGNALKELRLNAGLSQEQLGVMFSRRASNVAAWENGRSWPPPHFVRMMLEKALRISPEVLSQFYELEVNEDLSRKSYLAGDPLAIEARFFLSERGAILQALTDRAKLGDVPAIKTWFEREAAVAKALLARDTTKPRQIEGGKADEWTKRALGEGVGGRGLPLDGGGEDVLVPHPTPTEKTGLQEEEAPVEDGPKGEQ